MIRFKLNKKAILGKKCYEKLLLLEKMVCSGKIKFKTYLLMHYFQKYRILLFQHL